MDFVMLGIQPLERLASVVLILLALIVGLGIVLIRDFWGVSWASGTGVFTMLTVWAALIAAAAALENGSHVTLSVVVNRAPPALKRPIQIVQSAITLLFSSWLLLLSVSYDQQLHDTGGMSLFTDLPTWVEFVGIPVAFALMTLHSVRQLLQALLGLARDEKGLGV
jgi:C4-dicarboxylate transporter DctQ subunit